MRRQNTPWKGFAILVVAIIHAHAVKLLTYLHLMASTIAICRVCAGKVEHPHYTTIFSRYSLQAGLPGRLSSVLGVSVVQNDSCPQKFVNHAWGRLHQWRPISSSCRKLLRLATINLLVDLPVERGPKTPVVVWEYHLTHNVPNLLLNELHLAVFSFNMTVSTHTALKNNIILLQQINNALFLMLTWLLGGGSLSDITNTTHSQSVTYHHSH